MSFRAGALLLLLSPITGLSQEPSLYPIVRDLKIGFIDRQGRMVIEPKFSAGGGTMPRFSEGLAPVAEAGGITSILYGYTDIHGTVVIPFQFEQAEPFSEGLAAARKGKWGFIDHSGAWKVNPEYDIVAPFSEGLARVQRGDKIGYVDKNGFMAIEAKFLPRSESFSEGVAAVVTDERKAGFIDRNGNWMIAPRYNDARSFHNGLALAGGYVIDHSGKPVAGPFDLALGFSDGLVRVGEGSKSEFIAIHGKVQFTAPGDLVFPFSEGLARFSVHDSHGMYKTGFIDSKGTIAIPPIYDQAESFKDGIAFAAACGQTGYITKDGAPVFGLQFGTNEVALGPAPPPSTVTAEMIESISHYPGPLTLSKVAVPEICDADGKKIWSLSVEAPDHTFRPLTISLLAGGTFLTEERLGNLRGAREQLHEVHIKMAEEMLKRLEEYANTEEGKRDTRIAGRIGQAAEEIKKLQTNAADPIENAFFHPVAGKGFNGYFMTRGGGGTVSIFSPAKQYELQVVGSPSDFGGPRAAEISKDYAKWANSPDSVEEVALEIASRLFPVAK
jgi:hypothetical protein